VRRDVVLKTQRAELVGGAPVCAEGFKHGHQLKL
jgi:hypothetical protein